MDQAATKLMACKWINVVVRSQMLQANDKADKYRIEGVAGWNSERTFKVKLSRNVDG